MASIAIMRDYVGKQYGGSWPEKVRRMPDYQVASIYRKMIDQAERKKKQPEKYHQMSMFEDPNFTYGYSKEDKE